MGRSWDVLHVGWSSYSQDLVGIGTPQPAVSAAKFSAQVQTRHDGAGLISFFKRSYQRVN